MHLDKISRDSQKQDRRIDCAARLTFDAISGRHVDRE